MFQSTPPINYEYQVIEKKLYNNLIVSGYDCSSLVVMEAYVKEIPNLQLTPSRKFSKLNKFRKAGLIGCLNASGLTSKNYKDELYKDN